MGAMRWVEQENMTKKVDVRAVHLLLCAGDLLHAECDELVQLPALLLLALVLHQGPHQILHMRHADFS